MAALFFLIIVAFSFLIVRIGAVALELTGLPWEHAKFQALSAFSNAGFTTRESERITSHVARRKIVSMLIVLGNAGLVTLVGTFASAMLRGPLDEGLLTLMFLLGGVGTLIWVFHLPPVKSKLRKSAIKWLEARYELESTSPEDLLRLDDEYTITKITLEKNSPAIGKTLSELSLKQKAVQVLAVERGTIFRAVPRGDQTIEAGDKLVVYGKKDSLGALFKPTEMEALTVTEKAGEENSSSKSFSEPLK